MKIERRQLLLYAVTDRSFTQAGTLYEQIEDALAGGVTMVQLREKHLDPDAFVDEAIEIKALCHRYNVPLIVNDNIEVALKSGADGVHVGAEDTPVSEIRKMAGENFIIGATAKTVEQAQAAQAAGADYLGVGAVFPSPTKKNAVRITTGQLHEICMSVSIPAVAIGGICLDNIDSLQGGGMAGVAVISGIFGAKNIKTAAADLKKKAEALCK